MNCPELVEGHHYQVTPDWPVVLSLPVVAETHDFGAVYEFYTGHRLLARHERGETTIMPGYACDGYSPVIKKPRWMPGKDRFIRLTPTPSCGMFPAVLHDFTRQFMAVPNCPWNREKSDDWLFDSLEAGGCSEKAGAYHAAVAGGIGTAFIYLTRQPAPQLVILRRKYL
jgi:hypothetical protein